MPSPSAKPASQYAPLLSSVRSEIINLERLISTRNLSSIEPARCASSNLRISKPVSDTAFLITLINTLSSIGFSNYIAIKANLLSLLECCNA